MAVFRTRALLWLLVLLLPVGLTSVVAAEDSNEHQLKFGDRNRSYYLHVPADYDASGDAVPLVVALHPYASSGKAMAAITGLDATADEQGFIVAYPDSAGFYWDDYRGVSKVGLADEEIDDTGFLNALVDSLSGKYNIDPKQVHLTGLGNGGTMAFRVACETPERYASIAVVGALLWTYQTKLCPESTAPVNLLLVHGTKDNFFPVEAVQIEGQDDYILSRADTLAYLKKRLGCDTATVDDAVTTYNGCADGSSLALYSITDGGNIWYHLNDAHKLNRFNIVLNALLTAYFSGGDWQQYAIEPATKDIQARTYILYVPPDYDPSLPTALVLLLHGRPQTSTGLAYTTDMNHVAKRENFIAVYPQGVENQWSYGLNWVLYQGLTINDDEFLDNLLDDLALDLNIDPQRTYVTGYSNGGFMTQRLACTLHHRFAAFASLGATAPAGIVQACEGQPPVPILFIHGTKDPSVAWDGTLVTVAGKQIFITAPMSGTLGFWGTHNGCTPDFVVEDLPKLGFTPDLETRVYTFKCPDYSALKLYMVIGGGHIWHGIRPTDDPQLGKGTMDFNASEVIWKFFKPYTLDMRNNTPVEVTPFVESTEEATAAATEPATVATDEPEATEAAASGG